MTAPARLLSVRLQGFKSFAERTHVTFGPGISAIVGPNGSGKSNLADALRWALGEQGRALRSRRAEDVIWAGSERRPALGMADVQLTIDNGDALLPVEYGVVELGRRLFRSGENDYLLNRQRVRLRDLVDLLDGANLAENAFLFIGQGMVDQALSLRPEERRPLFEEVAGVRRPERRRRRAEDQLAEAEANLARVEDILGELRPQARRLAQQAEQQTSRRSAADELAEAILLAAHARWHAAARRVADATSAETRSRTAADRAMAELTRHEGTAAEIAGRLTGRATEEVERRAAVDRTREALTTLRLQDGRLAAEREGLDRERRRLATEGAAAAADLAAAREVTALPGVPADAGGDALPAIEAELAAAREELASLGGRDAGDADAATVRRLVAVRAAEHEAAIRRAADATRVAVEERSRADDQVRRAEAANAARATIGERLAAAVAEESTAQAAREAAQARRDEAEAERRHALDQASAARASLAAAEARADEARRQLDADDADAFRVAARAGGGRPVNDELAVDPSLGAAVDAALAELGRAVVVRRGAIEALLGQRGLAIVAEALEPPDPRPSGARREPSEDAFIAAVRGHGGGLLDEAVRRDGSGAARRLLARAAWLPDAATCLELQASMPSGWITVAADGSLVVRALTASIRPDGGSIRRRSDLERRIAAAAETRSTAAAAERALAAAAAVGEAAARELAAAQAAETAAVARRRRLEEEDRAAAGAATSAAREAAWLVAQADRLETQAERFRTDAADLAAAIPIAEGSQDDDAAEGAARTALERRIRELGSRRDRLAADVAAAAAARTEADRRRARAEAATALAERRRDDLDRATAALAERDAALTAERDAVAGSIAAAARSVAAAEEALQAVLGEGAADREQLRAAEAAAAAAREAVREAEDRARRAERDQLEARLALESLRESLLVDLAGLGALGLRHLTGTATGDAEADPRPAAEAAAALAEDVEPDDLEAALTAAAERWQASPPAGEAPSPGRIAVLRRRFHELGAGNPFAVEEYAEVKARLDALESQRSDLLAAIDQTRSLIRELERLIGDQFRTTFAALERAFDERFQQLFGGGFARLALTDPDDLTSTGVEITARPPGKKPQALAMLSGGERALTAVALLFAMLQVRPVPFCVLDEVDAALDEANIGRFTEALRELSVRTQCIVITHNRGTIEIADALYGVTVGDDSVSRVISLRLDEATELASRNGERAQAAEPADRDALAEPPLVVGG